MFWRDGVIYRQIQPSYQSHFERLHSTGLWKELVAAGLVVAEEDADLELAIVPGAFAVRKPEPVPSISYPYEWSFGQLKAAALITLEITRRCIGHRMVLKDATAYNIQFLRGRPVLIDTLSFENRDTPSPWIAYRQFCQHFLAPLALAAHVDVRLLDLLRIHLDGIPLDLASRLLPSKTKLQPGLLTHLHLHAKAIQSHSSSNHSEQAAKATLSDQALLALVDHLRSTIEGLRWEPSGTQWGDYYSDTNYSREAADLKAETVKKCLEAAASPGAMCWDLGANNGRYSLIAAELGYETVAWDIDPAAVEQAFRYLGSSRQERLLPLRLDLTNPSPGVGWMNEERDGFLNRGPARVVLALALVHHLCLTFHIPVAGVVDLLARAGRDAVVEYVPLDDSQVKRMVSTHTRGFEEYTLSAFREALAARFSVVDEIPIPGTLRTLFWARQL